MYDVRIVSTVVVVVAFVFAILIPLMQVFASYAPASDVVVIVAAAVGC